METISQNVVQVMIDCGALLNHSFKLVASANNCGMHPAEQQSQSLIIK